jgi:hypothetical protein
MFARSVSKCWQQQLAHAEEVLDLLAAAICCPAPSCQPLQLGNVSDDPCQLLRTRCICRCLPRACCHHHATVICCTCTTTGCTCLEARTSWAPALCRCSRHTSHAQRWTGLGRCMRQLLEVAAWGQVATRSRCAACAGCLGALMWLAYAFCVHLIMCMPAAAVLFSAGVGQQR